MARGSNVANNVTLFLAILLTSIITHILTISMIPPSSPYHPSFMKPPTIRRSNQLKSESTIVTFASTVTTKGSDEMAGSDVGRIEKDRNDKDAGVAASATKMTNAIDSNKNLQDSQPKKVVDSPADKGKTLTDRGNSNADNPVAKPTIEAARKIPPSRDSKVVAEQVEIKVDQGSSQTTFVEPVISTVVVSTAKKHQPRDQPKSKIKETVAKELKVPDTGPGSPTTTVNASATTLNSMERGKKPSSDVQAKPSKSIKPIEMAPLGQSKWIGNDWYPPPGGKLYDIYMLKHLFGKFNILWVGDEEVQQLYNGLMAILHSEDAVVEPSNFDRRWGQPCETDISLTACTKFAGMKLDFAATTCLTQIRDLISNRDVSKYDVMIVNYGLQEMYGLCPFVISDKQLMFADVVSRLKKLPVPVTWTTMAWLDFNIIGVNLKVVSVIDKEKGNLSLFDYGAGMQQRKETIEYFKKKKRLSYTMPARMAYIQMLANHLNQQLPHQ